MKEKGAAFEREALESVKTVEKAGFMDVPTYTLSNLDRDKQAEGFLVE